ncbi:TolC family protein [Phycisphaerales bacterium AB-hyl4]|uniref:TolC family protein n=1 Tax=Natronomicrosphaera hydrolytica TaxID=3242702 RepID=A0ABV4U936_9BACT
MTRTFLTWAAVWLMTGSLAWGRDGEGEGDVLTLSVEQAVVLAVQHNRALRVEQLQPSIVGQFERIERASYDPLLLMEVAYGRSAVRTGDDGNIDRASQLLLDARILQRVPTGTVLELEAQHERLSPDGEPTEHVARVGLTVTQALLRGASVGANLVDIRQARLETQISQYELYGFVESLVAEVEQTYWQLVLLKRQIELVGHALEVARTQEDHVERRIAAGALARTELAAARAEVALREEALIVAEAAAQVERLAFLRLVNPPGGPSWDRPVRLLDEPEPLLKTLDEASAHAALAVQLRADLNEAHLRLEQGRLEVRRTRNGLLPRLDLFASLGQTGHADTLGRSWREVDGSRSYDMTVGARFEQALGNREARARYEVARASRRQAAEAVANVRQIVELDVRLAHLEVQRAQEQITATRATRALREATLRAEQAKFAAGSSTVLLVAQAQRDLLESQIAEVQAMVEHRQAVIELYRLDGSLLQRRGVNVRMAE